MHEPAHIFIHIYICTCTYAYSNTHTCASHARMYVRTCMYILYLHTAAMYMQVSGYSLVREILFN